MKVCIIGGGIAYSRMFIDRGWEITEHILEADLVQFCGGADVTPSFYGEVSHPTTGNSPMQDHREAAVYDMARESGIPMAGICRGGQFLNVMNGGKMYQHVDGHAIAGTHRAYDRTTKVFMQVTSTHHQMMRAGDGADILCTAAEATFLEYMGGDQGANAIVFDEPDGMDTEALYYHATKSLCFQPHPEFNGCEECRDYYFELIQRELGLVV